MMSSCVFDDNTAYGFGGELSFVSFNGITGNLLLAAEIVIVNSNKAHSGGALYGNLLNTINITRSKFISNIALGKHGSVMLLESRNTVLLKEVDFAKNLAALNGGAVKLTLSINSYKLYICNQNNLKNKISSF
jgi:hypothetical protein